MEDDMSVELSVATEVPHHHVLPLGKTRIVVHVMDALGLSSKSKMGLIVRFELVDTAASSDKDLALVRLYLCETSRCLNFRHMFWDQKVYLPIPPELEKADPERYLLRTLLIRPGKRGTQGLEVRYPEQMVAMHERRYAETMQELSVEGTRTEMVWPLQTMSLDGDTQVRLRVGLSQVSGDTFDEEVGNDGLGLGLGLTLPRADGVSIGASEDESTTMPPKVPRHASQSILEKFVQLFDDKFDRVPVKTLCEFLRMHVDDGAAAAVAKQVPSATPPDLDIDAKRAVQDVFESAASDFAHSVSVVRNVPVVEKKQALQLVKSCLRSMEGGAENSVRSTATHGTNGAATGVPEAAATGSDSFTPISTSDNLPGAIAQLDQLTTKLGENIMDVTEQLARLGMPAKPILPGVERKGSKGKQQPASLPSVVNLESAHAVWELTTSMKGQLDSVSHALDSVVRTDSLPAPLRASSLQIVDGLVVGAIDMRNKIRNATDVLFAQLVATPAGAQLSSQVQQLISKNYADLIKSSDELRRIERRARALGDILRVDTNSSSPSKGNKDATLAVPPITDEDKVLSGLTAPPSESWRQPGADDRGDSSTPFVGLGRQQKPALTSARVKKLIASVHTRCPNRSVLLVSRALEMTLDACADKASDVARLFVLVTKDIDFELIRVLTRAHEDASSSPCVRMVRAGDVAAGVTAGCLEFLLEGVRGAAPADAKLAGIGAMVAGVDRATMGERSDESPSLSFLWWPKERGALLFIELVARCCSPEDADTARELATNALTAGLDAFVAALVLYAAFCVDVPCTPSEYVESLSMLLDASNVAETKGTYGVPGDENLTPPLSESDEVHIVRHLVALSSEGSSEKLTAVLNADPVLEASRFTLGGGGSTLLHVAASLNNLVLLRVLLERGRVRPMARDKVGRVASQLCQSAAALELFGTLGRSVGERVDVDIPPTVPSGLASKKGGESKRQLHRACLRVRVEKPPGGDLVEAVSTTYDATTNTLSVRDEVERDNPGAKLWDVSVAYGKIEFLVGGDDDDSELAKQLYAKLMVSEEAVRKEEAAQREVMAHIARLEEEERERQRKILAEAEERRRKEQEEEAEREARHAERLRLRLEKEKRLADEEKAEREKEELARQLALEGGELDIGEIVECRYSNSRDFFPGKIAEKRSKLGDDAYMHFIYDVQYDDGDFEEDVWRLRIRRPGQKESTDVLAPNTRIDAVCSRCEEDEDGPVRRAKVVRNTGGAIYTVRFLDEDLDGFEEALAREDMFGLHLGDASTQASVSESGAPADAVTEEAPRVDAGSDSADPPASAVGVEMKAAVEADRAEVDEGGELAPSPVAPKRLVTQPSLLPVLGVGDRIECRYGLEPNFYGGVVGEVDSFFRNGELEQLYHVQYDDGDVERAPRQKIRRDGERQERYLGIGQEVDAVLPHLGHVIPGIVSAASTEGDGDGDGEEEEKYVVLFALKELGFLDDFIAAAGSQPSGLSKDGNYECLLSRGDIYAPYLSKATLDADKDHAMMEAIGAVKKYIRGISPSHARVFMHFGSQRHEIGEALVTGDFSCWQDRKTETMFALQVFEARNMVSMTDIDLEDDTVNEALVKALAEHDNTTIESVLPEIAEPDDEKRVLWHIARVLQGRVLAGQAAAGVTGDPQSSPRSPRASDEPYTSGMTIVDKYVALERAVRMHAGAPDVPAGETWTSVNILRSVDDSAMMLGSHVEVQWKDGTRSWWRAPMDAEAPPPSMRSALEALGLSSSRETDQMLRALLSEVLVVDLGSRMSHLQLSRMAPCRAPKNTDGSLPTESPKGRTIAGAFDLLDKLCPNGMPLEIPASVGGDTYCVKFSRKAGGELYMIGPTARPDDTPWLCLWGLRGLAGPELLTASTTMKRMFDAERPVEQKVQTGTC